MIPLRGIFCLSLAATLFWGSGFVAERIAGAEPSIWSYAVPALVVTALIAVPVFRRWPGFLAVAADATGALLRSVALWTLLSYVGGAVVVGGLGHLLLSPGAQSSAAAYSEARLATYILALWFPLWFAPAAGVTLGWWRHARRRPRSGPAAERDGPRAARPRP